MVRKRQKVIRAAEKLVGRGKIEAAIDEYRKVLQESPNDTNTLNRVGDLYARLNRLDEAIALFKQTARHFGGEGFFVKAIAIYKKIIRLDPTQIEVYESLADLYHRQGLVSEARAQYQVVADYHQKHGDPAAVVAVHRKLVELEPDNPSHRLHLAELFQEAGDVAEAMSQYGGIASLMLSHGRVEEAGQVFRKALDIDAEDLSFIAGAVQELKEAGHAEEAEKFLRHAVGKNPKARRVEALAGLETEAPAAPPVEREPETPEPEAPADEPEVLVELEVEPAEPPAVEPAKEPAAAADEPAAAAPVEAPPPRVEPEEPEEPEEYVIDLDEIAAEEPLEVAEAAAAGATVADRSAELLSEAEVLSRYGLEDKAIERLEEAQADDPDNLEVLGRLIHLHLPAGNSARVAELANQVSRVASQRGVPDAFERVRRQLLGEGYRLEGGLVVPPAAAAPPPPAAPEPSVPIPVDVQWLEETPAAATDETTAEELFEAEEDFFDLASELEEELLKEEELLGEELVPPAEQSVEDIVEGFKKGMAETLSPEDYDTHYNLGIAYREMGLVDEAIGEFQLAAKDPRYLVDCCSLLASSFLEKGFPELAVKWYKRGLDSPSITEEETLGLVYELGDLYLRIGDTAAAKQRFVEIYGINSNYRDVVAKLQELGVS